MPRQRVGDIEIYYEVHGAGPRTLVLIRGLGSNLLAWYAQIDVLSQHYKCVVFDNRGAGRTDKPDAPYSIKQMADDAAGLMDALGIGRAALLGISMGGMIAQEFAINHQEKLSCLILGCTHFGGARRRADAAGNPRRDCGGIQRDSAAAEAGATGGVLRRHYRAPPRSGRERQSHPRAVCDSAVRVGAAGSGQPRTFDASARLGQIHVPTMVMTGREDRLVMPQNAKLIADRIPGAVLKELPGGHLFMSEYPEQFNRAVIDFIDAH